MAVMAGPVGSFEIDQEDGPDKHAQYDQRIGYATARLTNGAQNEIVIGEVNVVFDFALFEFVENFAHVIGKVLDEVQITP